MDEGTDRFVVSPAGALQGRLRVPGDKSISHRALIIAGVGEGTCRLSGLSSAADVQATARALRSLGIVIGDSKSQVEPQKSSGSQFEFQILVEGRGWDALRAPRDSIDCANSGTTARIILGVLASRPFTTELTGDASLRRRPMRRVVDPLEKMGATVEGEHGGDRLPLRITGGRLEGIEYRLPVASAQVKSAVLLAGLQASGETAVSEPERSRDHTERLLSYLGIPIHSESNRLIVKSTNVQNAEELRVPGDLSSAAFLLVAAALLPGSAVTVIDVGLNPTRTGFLDVLREFGAEVEIDDLREAFGEVWGTVTVRPGERRPVRVEADRVPSMIDELPLVAVLGAFAEGVTEVRGAAELRVKESDRIATIAAGLGAMGARIETLDDGLTVTGPASLKGGRVDSAGDHRIAMALAVAGLVADGPTEITGWSSVAVSYPEFLQDLESLVAR